MQHRDSDVGGGAGLGLLDGLWPLRAEKRTFEVGLAGLQRGPALGFGRRQVLGLDEIDVHGLALPAWFAAS
jgi:hypothetical protein